MAPFIDVIDVSHTYALEDGRRVLALRGVNLQVERGEFVALIGGNGSGKSTLARHLNGLLLPTSGLVSIDGLVTANPRHLPVIRQRVGMVFQNPEHQLVASTIEEDVAFGPENQGLPPEEISQRVNEALALTGLAGLRLRPPHMLSGGQKQRVAIAGALASRPACIIFDEPTSMLDAPGRKEVLEVIHRLNLEEGITILLITQSMDEAVTARRVLVLEAGQLVRDGPPEVVFESMALDEPLSMVRPYDLDLPFVIDLAHRLGEQGIPLPKGLLTIEQLVKALC